MAALNTDGYAATFENAGSVTVTGNVSLSGDWTIGPGTAAIDYTGTITTNGHNIYIEAPVTFSGAVDLSGGSVIETETGTLATPVAVAGAVADGSFESPTTGDWVQNPTGTPWAFFNGGIFTNGSDWQVPTVPDGSQGAVVFGNGWFGQGIDVPAAGAYAVSFFDASPANNGGASTDYEVLLDGNVVGTYSSASTAWTSHTTASLTLTAGEHALEFVDLSGNAAAIDDVNLVAYQSQGSANLTGTVNVTGAATLEEADGQNNLVVSGNITGSGTLSISSTSLVAGGGQGYVSNQNVWSDSPVPQSTTWVAAALPVAGYGPVSGLPTDGGTIEYSFEMYSATGYIAFQGDNNWGWGVSIDGQACNWGGAGWTLDRLQTNFGMGPHNDGWHDVEFFYMTVNGQNAGPVMNSTTNGELLWTTNPAAANENMTFTGPYQDWHSFSDFSDPANYVNGQFILQPSLTQTVTAIPTQILFSGDNSAFTGTINVSQGTLLAASATALGTGTAVSLGSGAELQTTASTTNVSLTTTGAATLNVAAGTTFTVTGATTLGGNLTVTGGGDVDFAGSFTANGATITLDNPSTTLGGAVYLDGTTTFDVISGSSLGVLGAISDGTTSSGLTLSGPGTVTLGADATYTGVTAIDAGTLVLGTGVDSAVLANNTVDLSGGTLDFGALTAVTLGGLEGSSGLLLANDAGDPVQLSVGYDNAGTTYAGPLTGVTAGSDTSELIKVGTGTLILAAPGVLPSSVAIVDPDDLVLAGGVLSVTAPTVMVGTPLTLTAEVADPFGQCQGVSFYTDVNGTGQLSAGDTLLAVATYQDGVWTATIDTTGWSTTTATGFTPSTENVLAEATFATSTHPAPTSTTASEPLSITGDGAFAFIGPNDNAAQGYSTSGTLSVYTFTGLAPGNYEVWYRNPMDETYGGNVNASVYDGPRFGTAEQTFTINLSASTPWPNWSFPSQPGDNGNTNGWGWSGATLTNNSPLIVYVNSGADTPAGVTLTVTVNLVDGGLAPEICLIGDPGSAAPYDPGTPGGPQVSQGGIEYANGGIQASSSGAYAPPGSDYSNATGMLDLGIFGYSRPTPPSSLLTPNQKNTGPTPPSMTTIPQNGDNNPYIFPQLNGDGMAVAALGISSCYSYWIEPYRNYLPMYGTKDTLVDTSTDGVHGNLNLTAADGTVYVFGEPGLDGPYATAPWQETISPDGQISQVTAWTTYTTPPLGAGAPRNRHVARGQHTSD